MLAKGVGLHSIPFLILFSLVIPHRLGLLSDAPVKLLGSPLESLAAHLAEELRLGKPH